ncbi:MAG: tetratricopeptide repeat protein [Richelia sp. SL_2_1]|nr:tetratricopeptide repeat protein [Richelia sp. RM1_1_1]NJO31057.1 tetratricopeptide repeat protein [Richelia sp. SL_2_1]
MNNQNQPQKVGQRHQLWTSRAVALFFTLFLLSESTIANVKGYGLEIAQQTVSAPSVPLSADKQQRYQEGVKLYQEAQEFQKKGTREGYQEAIAKYQQALKIVQELGLRADQAEILMEIGLVNVYLSEYQQALDLYKQALKIWQELNQPLFEATALSMIGDTYNNMGKTRESLEYLKQAESSFRIQKQFRHLAINLSSISRAYMRLGETKNAINYLNQALEIYRTTFKDGKKEAHTLNSIAFIYSQIGEYEIALTHYNQALKIYREKQDLLGEAEIFKNIGSLHGKLGKHDLALDYLNKALEIQSTKGTLVDRGSTINDIASIYSSRGDYEKAVEYYQKAKLLFNESGWTTLESLSLGSIVSIYRNFLGNNQQALKYTEEVLELNRKTGEKDEEASTLNQQGDIYIQQGDYQLALDHYNEALQIELSITKNPKAAARTLGNIALLYNSLGDSNLSIRTYNQALDIYRKLDNKAQQARTLIYTGGVYQKNGQFNEALTSYNEALKLLNKEDYIYEISIRYGLARTYRDQKDYPRAFEAANLALELSKKHKSSFQEIASIEIIGSIYIAQGDYKNALDSYQKALNGYRQSKLKPKEAETLNTISMAYSFEKQYQQAISTLNEEIKLRQTLKDKTGEAQANYQIAINQRKLENLETALTNIDSAIKIVENIRTNVQNPDLRTSYFATVQNYYKFKINLLMELHKKDPSKGYNAQAIETSEASRARGLVELLTEARANIRKGANPELLAQEKRLQDLINAKEKLRFEIINSDKIKNPVFKANADNLQTEIDELLNQQKQLETKIRQSNPKYANLKYPQPLKLAQIQQQLDKDSLLLQYSLGEERSFLWVVSPTSLDTYELPKKSEIDKASINLFCLISQNSSKPPSATGKENPCQDTKNIKTRQIDLAAEELSKLVLAPVKDKLGKKRLVVVTDGALQYIPFAALADLTAQSTSQRGKEKKNQLDNKPKDNRGGGLIPEIDNLPPATNSNYQPLFINHEIVNLPSASTIAIQRQELANRSSTNKKTLAILADPVYNADDAKIRLQNARNKETKPKPSDSLGIELERSALKRSADILNRQGWGRLPGTRTEADTILKLVPDGDRLTVFDFDANYNWATSSALNQFRILHFATHGFVNDANPELSGIVLSLVDKQGKDIRGYLRLGDLFNLDYPADLIVLSACETGLGKEIQGEGLVGLTRGLMYAGGERLVVSLWQVSDEGTAVFMQEFYKEMLQESKSPNEALRATQLKMWSQEKWRNPNYWAAFAFLGEWR